MSKIASDSFQGGGGPGPAALRFTLLGPFSLSLGASAIAVGSSSSRALLAILALASGQRVTRERLCGLLWGDRGEEQARSSLRQSLAALRRELGDAEAQVFSQQDDVLALRTDTLAVDVLDIVKMSGSGDRERLQQAVQLCRGELLADIALCEAAFEDWLSFEKRRIADVILGLHERFVGSERGTAAVEAARKLLALDPFRENSHRLLMQVLAATGERALALKQYEECARLLKAEYGVEPARETQELRQKITEEKARPGGSSVISVARSDSAPASQAPAVAVLPFAFHGGDGLRYLEEGIAEDIATELSRHRTLRVIASASAATQRGVHDPQLAGRTLGATHVVAGSFRPAGDNFRMSAQLVEVESGASLWSERYDLSRDDVQSSLDRLVIAIAPIIEGRIGSASAEQVSRRPIASWTAYDHYLKGRDLSLRYRDTEAFPHLQKAIELDPTFAPAFAWRAFAQVGMEFWRTASRKVDLAEQSARRAVQLDETDVRGHHAMGYVRLWQKKHDLAGHHYERGLALNPCDFLINYDKANWLTYTGRPAEGLVLAASMQERDPFPPPFVFEIRGRALFQMGRFAEALADFEKVSAHHVWCHWWRAAAFANLDRMPEAAEEIRRLRTEKPGVNLSFIRGLTAFSSPAFCQTLFDSLKAAGLPD